MRKTESIHVGFISEYKQNKAIINVAGKDYHVSLTKEEADFLEDMMYNIKLNYIAFDTANKSIITYDVFRKTYGEKEFKNLYVTFIKIFKG